DGALWIAECGCGEGINYTSSTRLGRLTTRGSLSHFATADTAPFYIAAGADGNLWFTHAWPPAIGRSTLAGAITRFPLGSNSDALQIAAGADGNLWFTGFNGFTYLIGRI